MARAAVAEILASDRLSEFSGTLIDPIQARERFSAVVTLGLPIKRELTKAEHHLCHHGQTSADLPPIAW